MYCLHADIGKQLGYVAVWILIGYIRIKIHADHKPNPTWFWNRSGTKIIVVGFDSRTANPFTMIIIVLPYVLKL